jgi:hypothetical protein
LISKLSHGSILFMAPIRLLLFVAAWLGAVVPQARAIFIAGDPTDGSSFTFNFDENGNGSISVEGGSFTTLTGTLMPDPTQGGLPVLTYLLPRIVIGGDARIWDDFIGGQLSDVLRFTDAAGTPYTFSADRMIFYSNLPGSGDPPALADTGIPETLYVNEFGGTVESDGAFSWVPAGPAGHTYNGLSEVPEPSSLALLCLAAGIILRGGRKVT